MRDQELGEQRHSPVREDGKHKFSGLDVEAAIELLAALNAATTLADLSPLKSSVSTNSLATGGVSGR